MRWTIVALLTLVACNDLREFQGDWRGPRVGTGVVRTGLGSATSAALSIDRADEHGFSARLTIDGELPETAIASLASAEADVLAGITFSGSPLRVYLAFVGMPSAGAEALVVIALYDDRRVELRVLRGGAQPIYGIFALAEPPPEPLP